MKRKRKITIVHSPQARSFQRSGRLCSTPRFAALGNGSLRLDADAEAAWGSNGKPSIRYARGPTFADDILARVAKTAFDRRSVANSSA